MSLRRKAIKGVKWSAFQNIILRLSSFLVLLVLARVLDPVHFGLIALADLAINFSQIFIGAGFASSIVQRDKLEPEHLNTAFWVNIGVGLFLMTLLLLLAGPIANIFEQPDLKPVIVWLSLGLMFSSLSQVQTAILKRELAFRALAIRSVIAEPIAGALAVVLALLGFGIWSLVFRALAASLVKTIILWRASDWRPGFSVSLRHFNDLFSFGVNMLATNIVQFFSRQSIVALIGYFLGPIALGYYNVATRLYILLEQSLGGVINSVAWPVFSRLQNEPERLKSAFYSATSIVSLVASPVFFGLIAVAPEIIPVVFGAKWTPAIPIIQILALLGFLRTMFQINGSVIVAMGKPQWRLALFAAIGLLSVCLFFMVLSKGLTAVAAAYTVAWYVLAPISLWMVQRLINIDLIKYLRLHLVPIAATVAMLVVVRGLTVLLESQHMAGARLALVIAIGAVTYVVTVYLLSPRLIDTVKGFMRDAGPGQRSGK